MIAPIKLPSTPEEVVAFIGSNFSSHWDKGLLEDHSYSISVHDLLSSFQDLADAATQLVAPVDLSELHRYDLNGDGPCFAPNDGSYVLFDDVLALLAAAPAIKPGYVATTTEELAEVLDRIVAEKNAPAPATPAASVDTAEFRKVLRMWRELQNGDDEGNFLRIVYHTDAHTARAVAAALEGQRAQVKHLEHRRDLALRANAALSGKLDAVWKDIENIIEAHTGAPVVGEPMDALEAALAAAPKQHAQAALSDEPVAFEIIEDEGPAGGPEKLRTVFERVKPKEENFAPGRLRSIRPLVYGDVVNHQPAAAPAQPEVKP